MFLIIPSELVLPLGRVGQVFSLISGKSPAIKVKPFFPRCYLAPCDGGNKYGYSDSDFTNFDFALINNDSLTR